MRRSHIPNRRQGNRGRPSALPVRVESGQLDCTLNDGNQIVFNELACGIADEFLLVGEKGIELNEIDTTKFDGRHENLPSYELCTPVPAHNRNHGCYPAEQSERDRANK
jgi:hypothetical protein